jgi:hypothetical protein
MYGRADGMPSFQLTVAVCACTYKLDQYISWANGEATGSVDRQVISSGKHVNRVDL